MKYYYLLILLLLGACTNPDSSNVETKATPEAQQLPEGKSFSIESAAQANNQMGLELFLKLRKGVGGNLFISPYSISNALGMTYAGAANATEKEMGEFMHWPANTKALHQGLSEQMQQLHAHHQQLYKINIANRIYLNQGRSLFEEFAKVNQASYGVGVEALNFQESTKAAQQINDWVSLKTEKMIPKLLNAELLKQAEMVLVNAIFFYGGWANPFKEEMTKSDTFFLEAQNTKMTDMMYRYWKHDDDELEEGFNYYEDATFQVLALPYHQNKGSMIIFLPQKNDSITYDLDSLMADMSYDNLVKRINALEYVSADVELKLPKWTQRRQVLLKSYCQSMGMQAPFSDAADFSRMTDEMNLKISEIVHEAVVEVTEKGTKAAASTAVVTKETAARPAERTIRFIANRPFFYLIKDNETNTFLFMGQLLDPK